MEEQIIVIATKNEGKKEEIIKILEDYPVKIMSLNDFGPTPEHKEESDTFEDNAYFKALFYAKILGLPTLADDSGLVVEALDGAPGIHSARYAGEEASDKDRYEKLLIEMEGKDNRKAAFVCALVLAVPWGPGLTWVNQCQGEITEKPIGDNGFGYDPVFMYPEFGKTFGQISMEEKNKVSHRGKALAEFKAEFSKVLTWTRQRMKEMEPPNPHHH